MRTDAETKAKLVNVATNMGYITIERDVLNVAEKIQDYDPNLRLKFCEQASVNDPPYKLFELCPDGVERRVMDIWELDDRVIERLHAADNARTNVLVDIDNNNLLAKAIEDRRYKEEMAEAKDMLLHYLKSPKGRYSMKIPETGVKVTIDDQEGIPAKIERP